MPEFARVRETDVAPARENRRDTGQPPRAVTVAPPPDGKLRPCLKDDEQCERQTDLGKGDAESTRHGAFDRRPDVLVRAHDAHHQGRRTSGIHLEKPSLWRARSA